MAPKAVALRQAGFRYREIAEALKVPIGSAYRLAGGRRDERRKEEAAQHDESR